MYNNIRIVGEGDNYMGRAFLTASVRTTVVVKCIDIIVLI